MAAVVMVQIAEYLKLRIDKEKNQYYNIDQSIDQGTNRGSI